MRVVATDIDGTFITKKRDYDRRLFQRVYRLLVDQGIRFVIASGDQYYFLRSLFPGVADQLAYVAENGALTIDQGQEIACARLSFADVRAVAECLDCLPGVEYVVCGRQSAYINERFSPSFKQQMGQFYSRLKTVKSLDETKADRLFKFALTVPGKQTKEVKELIDTRFAGTIRATVSGYGAIDLIIPGMDKSYGLKLLLERWKVAPQDLVVFGDGENDLEMFHLAGTSYAMGNAPAVVQSQATHVIGTNDDQAELHTLAELLKIE